MYVQVQTSVAINPGFPVKLRCPACRQRGTFEMVNISDIQVASQAGPYIAGFRNCPDPSCGQLLAFIRPPLGGLTYYPPERIDFDATNIPADVLKPLQEAITCHASECFIAAAIMVRKTLEQLCLERGATGNNLKERIAALGGKVLIPAELLQGLDDLRLLGNDAAHIQSQEFNQVGKDEVEVGIEFAKEVLKAVYQYSALLGRLRALKKIP